MLKKMEMDPRIPAEKPLVYLELYEKIFAPLAHQEVRLLELGVRTGGSLLLWNNFFPKAQITGIDIHKVPNFPDEPRIQIYKGRQEDTRFLDRVAETVAPQGFDIIIDDASHQGALTKISFWHLFKHHLKPGGLFVIEDWGTGYWENFPDGGACTTKHDEIQKPGTKRFPSHDYGMVGFVKELIDECGAAAISRKDLSQAARRNSRFESVTVYPRQVVVRKIT